jgi:hypothetical protein
VGGLRGRGERVDHVTWEQQVSYLRATELQQNLEVERRMYTYPVLGPALYGTLLPDFLLFCFCDGIVVMAKGNGGESCNVRTGRWVGQGPSGEQ